jgi:glycosyltransferase involved in cell wall biosynthesis
LSSPLNPRVTVIIAAYNKAAFVAETIRSVQQQTSANFELLIIDDCSNDATVSIAKEFAENDSRIKLFAQTENRGANFCRNLGLKQAQGEYVIFLDADDLLAPHCLEERTALAATHPEANLFVFTMGVFYRKVGDDVHQWRPVASKPLQKFLSHDLPWSIMQPLWKRDLLLQLKGFDEDFDRMQDVELNTRALLHPTTKFFQEAGKPDCYYRIDANRKNFANYLFMKRWITSAVKYFSKFFNVVPHGERNRLYGTLYQVYTQLLLEFRKKQITEAELNELETSLLQPAVESAGRFKMSLFRVSRIYNLSGLRIPGVNKTLKSIIIK